MTNFVVNTRTFLFPTQETTTSGHPILEAGTRFPGTAIGRVIQSTDPARVGFVLTRHTDEVPTALRPITTTAEKTDFCELATVESRQELSDRNYLLAVAYHLSKNLGEFGAPEDEKIGPFRFSTADWLDGIAKAQARGQDYWPSQIFEWNFQMNIAAIRSSEAIKAFKAAEQDLPVPLELFFFERMGADAIAFLKLPPTTKCSAAITGAAPAGSYAAGIKARGDAPIGDAIKEVREGLMAGFAASREDVNRLPPFLRFFSDQDFAPWLTVASMLKGANLAVSAEKLPAQLMTVVNQPDPKRSAMFVGFCLKFCGVKQVQDSVPANSVGLPATWKTWQAVAPDPTPAGAIVITKAPAGGSQRVGILAAAPQGDTLQVFFCSESGEVDVAIEKIAKDQVEMFRWIALAGTPAAAGGGRGLGALSRMYESGNRGPGTVSTGNGDPGGVSYGLYQMTSKAVSGNLATVFVNEDAFPFKARFAGLTAGTPEYTAVWRAIAAEDADGFGTLQHDFIKRQLYDPLVSIVNANTGIDVSKAPRSAAVQDCCWSSAVQHGGSGGASIVSRVIKALQAAGTPLPADAKAFDEALLRGVYAERGRRNPDGTLAFFGTSSREVQEGVANRFRNELADALKMLNG
jgi:hypothetical protein